MMVLIGIGGTTTLDSITVSGFRTIPVGPVNAEFCLLRMTIKDK
jgi:hypothetical protein